MKMFEFWLEFHRSLFLREAIIWTSDGPGWWRIYVSLGLNELSRADIIFVSIVTLKLPTEMPNEYNITW